MIVPLKNQNIIKLINVALRIGGIGSKFLVFTLMSKYFETDIFGDYSLMTSIITISIFMLGLDFYNFSLRDILTTKDLPEIRSKVATTFILYCFIYALFVVLSYGLFGSIDYTRPFIWYLIGLCITEHLSQEIYRLLIGFRNVLLANILLFIRTVGWAIFILYFVLFDVLEVTIALIFKVWLLANSLTIMYVFGLAIAKNIQFKNAITIDFKWIKKGMRVCYLFFLATISLKAIEYANRFIIDYYLGKEIAGVFTFYSSLTILITVYINTIVISYELPELITYAKTNKIKGLFIKFKKSMTIQLIIGSLLLLVIIKPLLIWQNKPLFESYLPLIIFMVIGVGLMNYSLIYHFKLYVFHKDKAIFKIMMISGVLSIASAILLTATFGVYGCAISVVISGILLHLLRYREAKKIAYD